MRGSSLLVPLRPTVLSRPRIFLRCWSGVHIPGLGAFHSVLCLPGLLLSNQLCAAYVRLSSGVGECYHVAAPWEGKMLTGQALVQAPELGSASLEYPRLFSVTPSSPRELLNVLISSSFRSYFSICFSILSSWCLCHRLLSCSAVFSRRPRASAMTKEFPVCEQEEDAHEDHPEPVHFVVPVVFGCED